MTGQFPTRDSTRHFAHVFTRDHAQIELRWADDISPPNRSFINAEMSAWDGTERLGYLRTRRITQDSRALYHPTIWHYASTLEGTHLPHIEGNDTPGIHPTALCADAFAEFSIRAQSLLKRRINYSPDPFADYATMMAHLEKTDEFRDLRMRQFRFHAYHLGKPVVDYINTQESPYNGVSRDNSGRGIAILLYAACAIAHARNGERLHASFCQMQRARRIWDLFDALGWTDRKAPRLCDPHGKIRRFLVSERLPALADILSAAGLPRVARHRCVLVPA